MTNILRDAIADEQSRGPGLLAQTAPESVSEPDAPTTAPESPESHSGEIPAQSEANRCACGDTGSIKGERCPFCTKPACRFCGTLDEPRRLTLDGEGKAECVDEDACAVRDAGPVVPAPSEIGNHETPGWDAPATKGDEKHACALCGSERATTVYVTDGRLGSENEGVWRCSSARDCANRAALRTAREKIAE